MLFGTPTNKKSGITLWGDYKDLDNLYDTVGYLSETNILKGSLSDFVLGLCYDIRHAYQGSREIEIYGHDEIDKAKYYGVKILWPYFIIQVGLIRWAAGFTPTNNEQQSNLYRLENILETALKEASAPVADECMKWLNHFSGFSNEYLSNFLEEVTYRFVFDQTIHRKRINRLSIVLNMIDEWSYEYKEFKNQLVKVANKKGYKPEELTLSREWPKFMW